MAGGCRRWGPSGAGGRPLPGPRGALRAAAAANGSAAAQHPSAAALQRGIVGNSLPAAPPPRPPRPPTNRRAAPGHAPSATPGHAHPPRAARARPPSSRPRGPSARNRNGQRLRVPLCGVTRSCCACGTERRGWWARRGWAGGWTGVILAVFSNMNDSTHTPPAMTAPRCPINVVLSHWQHRRVMDDAYLCAVARV